MSQDALISGDQEKEALSSLFRKALLLRLCLAVAIHILAPEALFAPDQETYHFFGSWVARYWSGEVAVYPARLLVAGEPKAYYHLVAALYFVFGAWPLVPKLLNAVVGALTVRLVYDLAQKIAGNQAVALRAATYAAYFPSLVLWSVLNIRDCWVVLFIVVICRQAMALQDRMRLRSLLILGAAILGLTQFRHYLLFAVTLPMLLSFLIRDRRNLLRNTVLGMLVAGAVIVADQSAGMNRKLRTPDFERLNSMRRWSSSAAQSGFAEEVDISTPQKALAFLPVGLTYFFLAPFPWTVANLRQGFALPEMLFFYSLIPAIVRGIRALVRDRLSSSLMVLLITLGLTFGYAVGQGNVGTIYRHRAQVLNFYLIFAAVGVEVRRRRKTAFPVLDTVGAAPSTP